MIEWTIPPAANAWLTGVTEHYYVWSSSGTTAGTSDASAGSDSNGRALDGRTISASRQETYYGSSMTSHGLTGRTISFSSSSSFSETWTASATYLNGVSDSFGNIIYETLTNTDSYINTDSNKDSGLTTESFIMVDGATSTTESYEYVRNIPTFTTAETQRWTTRTTQLGSGTASTRATEFVATAATTTVTDVSGETMAMSVQATTNTGSHMTTPLAATVVEVRSKHDFNGSPEVLWSFTPVTSWRGLKPATDAAQSATRLTIEPFFETVEIPIITVKTEGYLGEAETTLGGADTTWTQYQTTYATTLTGSTLTRRTATRVYFDQLPNDTETFVGFDAITTTTTSFEVSIGPSSYNADEDIELSSFTDSLAAADGTTTAYTFATTTHAAAGTSRLGTRSWHVLRSVPTTYSYTETAAVLIENTWSGTTETSNQAIIEVNPNTEFGKTSGSTSWSNSGSFQKYTKRRGNTYKLLAPVGVGVAMGGTPQAEKWVRSGAELSATFGQRYSVALSGGRSSLPFKTAALNGREPARTILPHVDVNEQVTYHGSQVTYTGTTTNTVTGGPATTTTTISTRISAVGVTGTTRIIETPISGRGVMWGGSPVDTRETFINGTPVAGVYRNLTDGGTISAEAGATTFNSSKPVSQLRAIYHIAPADGEAATSHPDKAYWSVERNSKQLPPSVTYLGYLGY